MSKERELVQTHRIAVGTYVFIFAAKLAAYFLTGVMVLLAEALHTLTDVFISVFLLVTLGWSRKEADEIHMFGYGRAQYVAALVAATLFISFTSYRLYEEAIPKLFRHAEASYRNLPLALWVLIASILIAAVPLSMLLMQTKRRAAAKAQLTQLVNDELSLLAALAGAIFIMHGQPVADPIAAIIIASIIAFNAFRLFRENVSFLLGRSPGPELLSNVEKTARSVEGVKGVHDLRAEYIGPDTVRIQMHIEVRPGLPIEEAHSIAENVRQRIHESTSGEHRYCVIHVGMAVAHSKGMGVNQENDKAGKTS